MNVSRRTLGVAALGAAAASVPFVIARAADAGVTPAATHVDLTDPKKKEIAMELVSSAENSSLNWKAQYKYIEDVGDGRGYNVGVIGFCSGTGDMLDLVNLYDGSDSHRGLDPNFTRGWNRPQRTRFQQCRNDERDRVCFNPAVSRAKKDGLWALGQFCYYDA